MTKKGAITPPQSPIGMLYTTEEAAAILKQSPRTIQRMIKDKKLPAHKIGRAYKIRESDLMKLLDQTRTMPEGEEGKEESA